MHGARFAGMGCGCTTCLPSVTVPRPGRRAVARCRWRRSSLPVLGPGAFGPFQLQGPHVCSVRAMHDDRVVVVGQDHRPQPLPLLLVERGQLLVIVEDSDGPGRDEQPHPQRLVDAVVVEASMPWNITTSELVQAPDSTGWLQGLDKTARIPELIQPTAAQATGQRAAPCQFRPAGTLAQGRSATEACGPHPARGPVAGRPCREPR